MRARTSDPLPAGNDTTIVSGRVGQSSATAGVIAAASTAPRATLLNLDMATPQSRSTRHLSCSLLPELRGPPLECGAEAVLLPDLGELHAEFRFRGIERRQDLEPAMNRI